MPVGHLFPLTRPGALRPKGQAAWPQKKECLSVSAWCRVCSATPMSEVDIEASPMAGQSLPKQPLTRTVRLTGRERSSQGQVCDVFQFQFLFLALPLPPPVDGGTVAILRGLRDAARTGLPLSVDWSPATRLKKCDRLGCGCSRRGASRNLQRPSSSLLLPSRSLSDAHLAYSPRHVQSPQCDDSHSSITSRPRRHNSKRGRGWCCRKRRDARVRISCSRRSRALRVGFEFCAGRCPAGQRRCDCGPEEKEGTACACCREARGQRGGDNGHCVAKEREQAQEGATSTCEEDQWKGWYGHCHLNTGPFADGVS
jgi:hypothetical protein